MQTKSPKHDVFEVLFKAIEWLIGCWKVKVVLAFVESIIPHNSWKKKIQCRMLNGKANLYFYLGLWKLGKLKVVFCHVLVFAIISYIKDWLQLVVGYWTASWWWCCTCVSCLNTYGFTNYPVQGQKIFFFPWSDGQGSLEFLLCGDLWLLPAIILAFHSDS